MDFDSFVVNGSSFFLLCSLLSFIVVHYARDCSCTPAPENQYTAHPSVLHHSQLSAVSSQTRQLISMGVTPYKYRAIVHVHVHVHQLTE